MSPRSLWIIAQASFRSFWIIAEISPRSRVIIAEISPRSPRIITELASQGLADVFIKMRLPFESDEVRHME